MTAPNEGRGVPRVVLLGASNAVRGLSTAVETAALLLGTPLEVLCAVGHGRSYGMPSAVLGRTLPGILDCGLWEVLSSKPPADTCAVITDIGNDIMYGAAPETIAEWIGRCIDRLRGPGTRIVITRLPMTSLERLRPWQYQMMRAILFPTRLLSLADALSRARELDGRLGELIAERGVRGVELAGEWYRFDPIHLKMRHWPLAWHWILSALRDDLLRRPPQGSAEGGDGAPPTPLATGSVARWLRLHTCTPHRWWLLGMPQRRAQPSARLADGTTISLY